MILEDISNNLATPYTFFFANQYYNLTHKAFTIVIMRDVLFEYLLANDFFISLDFSNSDG
jgi:hypothetical protein